MILHTFCKRPEDEKEIELPTTPPGSGGSFSDETKEGTHIISFFNRKDKDEVVILRVTKGTSKEIGTMRLTEMEEGHLERIMGPGERYAMTITNGKLGPVELIFETDKV